MSAVIVHCHPAQAGVIDDCLRTGQAEPVAWTRQVRPPARRSAELALNAKRPSGQTVDRARVVVPDDRITDLLQPLFSLARAGRAGNGSISVARIPDAGQSGSGALNFYF